jgi:uncharacterized protein YcgI (DUF1989 family)
MTGGRVADFIVPASRGGAVLVPKGHTLRIVDVEGHQVADVVFYNAGDYSEVYSAGHSVYMNMRLGTGDSRMIKTFWSSPPDERVMLTVAADPVASHCVPLATCCSRYVYASSATYRDPDHRNCADNLMEALRPWNVPAHLPDVFNAFLNFDLLKWYDGDYNFNAPKSRPGDYLDLRAEIDLLVGISACPSDRTATNGYNPTPIGVQVFRPAS